MRIVVSLIFLTIFSYSAFAQINFKKLRDRVQKEIKKEVGDVKPDDLVNKDSRIAELRSSQLVKDTSYYNYIFSQGNRSSFFANRDSKENLLVTIAKNSGSEENAVKLEVYEQVFDLNRTAELSVYIHPQAARLNLKKALGLMVKEVPSFSSPFVIKDMVRMDTMNLADKYALGKTIANLSILLHAEGNYKLSENFLDETIEYFKENVSENTVALASLYANRATVSQSQGHFVEAEKYFNKAEKVIKRSGRIGSLSHAIVLNNRALFYNEIGQYDKALETIRRASEYANGALREKGRDNVSFQINEGLIHFSAGDYETAERTFREIIELKEKRFAKNQTDVGNVKNYLASTLMEMGKTDEVPVLLDHALAIFKRKYSESHPAYIKSKHNLGRYYLISGRFAEAKQVITEVRDGYLHTFSEFHPDYLSAIEDLAVVSWKVADYAQAKAYFDHVISSNLQLVEKYFGAMSEYEKTQYWAKIRPSILKFYAFAVDRQPADPTLLSDMYNLHLKTKGILLSASTKIREQILSSDDGQLKTTYKRWKAAKEKLLLYYSYSKEQLAEQKIDLPAQEEKANRLEKALNRMSTTFAQSNKLPTTTLAQVKGKLSSNDVAVEIVGFPAFDRRFTNEKNYAFLIADLESVHPSLVMISDGQDLDTKYAKAYRNLVKIKTNDRLTYDKFWRPVDEKLRGKKDVYLSLDGIYFQVNIGALQRPDGTFVSDHLKLHLYASTRDLVGTEENRITDKKAIFFGDPTFGSKGLLSELPGTEVEIKEVSKISRERGYAAHVYLHEDATEKNFKQLTSPSLLHIATHGFFLPESQATGEKVFGVEVSQVQDNPLLRSGLMLANAEDAIDDKTSRAEANTTNNGILTAYEVTTLDLNQTDLVVLSACETGLGEIKSGEGVYGLQRSFQVAGAKSVIMSLWKVSDEATKQLMKSFYDEWMGGRPKEEAFFEAQKKLRASYPEPYYWGAFVMLN